MEMDGDDLRPLLIESRKAPLTRFLARAGFGLALCEHIEADGPTVFRQACRTGPEGTSN